MARHGIGEAAASVAVLAMTAGFLSYVVSATDGGHENGLPLRAVFTASTGLAAGASVEIAGVKVGSVTGVQLDTATMLSDVSFRIRPDLRLPSDTEAAIGDGGFGTGASLTLDPGHAATIFERNGVITATTPAQSLEEQVGNYIFGAGIGQSR